MTDNGNNPRPVRTLTVKNFSVIKEAKLEFGKITVLIGPPSSGKSLLCKLAYFLGGEIIGFAVDSLLNRDSWDEFLQTVGREFNARFSTRRWLKTNSKASFSSERYFVELHGAGDPLDPKVNFTFGSGFQKLYSQISNNSLKQPSYPNLALSELRQDLWIELSLSLNKKRSQANIYIPSGRSFFTDQGKSVSALQNPDLDQITKRFAGLIAWDTKWKVGLLRTGRDVVPEIEKEIYRIAGGAVIVVDGKPHFLSADGRSLPLSLQSSGTQEMLPLLIMIDYLASYQEHFYARATSAKKSPLAEISDYSPLIYLEEPEAHIFPRNQYELVKLFAWLANDPILSFDWTITTHSPYVLSSFNNLIMAGQLANERPELRGEIAKLVPEQFWVEDGSLKAYCIREQVLEPILSKSRLIDGEYLDSVSDTIGNEFDELLRLEYDHTEAS